MSKRFRENGVRFLKSIYYMEKPRKITRDLKKRMSVEEIAEITLFLEKKGLVVIKNENPPFHISLTDKGVEFIVNEIDRKNQTEFNRIIAFTAGILALIGIYTFIKDLGLVNETNFWIKYVFLTFAVIAIVPIVAFIINSYFGER